MKGKGGFLERKIEREGQLQRKREREIISAEILAQFNFLTDLARETGHEERERG